jgi:hypothetical protein
LLAASCNGYLCLFCEGLQDDGAQETAQRARIAVREPHLGHEATVLVRPCQQSMQDLYMLQQLGVLQELESQWQYACFQEMA